MSAATDNVKEMLLLNLKVQESYMRKNAEMMTEIYGDHAENAYELKGAANIVQRWIEKIEQELTP